jgi:hypothetical protein
MTFVSLTRLRVRSLRFLLPFVWQVRKSARQAARTSGFLGGRLLREARNTFWTITAWENETAMRAYRNAGAHRGVMPKLLEWCDEASVAHWTQEGPELPDWQEAHRRMIKDGRPSKVNHPSPEQIANHTAPPQPSRIEQTLKPIKQSALKNHLTLIVLVLLSLQMVAAQNKPRVPDIDRVRLAEAFRIGETLGNRIWAGWTKAPFAVLLVTPENEFLIRHPKPSADFTLIHYDPLLQSKVYYRRRTQPLNLLATFPIVGGVPTIVIGQAENTAKKTSTPWVVTMLHEHFHQLQYSQPDYYRQVEALGLSRGDQSGMWMLNYPFPYDWPEMKEHFSLLSRLLAEALQARNSSEFAAKLSAYLRQRDELGKTLSPDDYRYFSFQMWQEGIARYTEYRIAKLAAGKYKSSKAFRALKDYKPFAEVAQQIKSGILDELTTGKLEDNKRVMFYPLGAGEGLLLDRTNPRWRQHYFVDKFYLDKYFDRTR